MSRSPWPRSAKLTALALSLALFGTAVAFVVTLVLGGESSSNAPTLATSTNTPSNLYTESYKASRSLTELGIGQTRFTTFGVTESAPNQMVPLARDKAGHLCVTDEARTWEEPAGQVGYSMTINIAITRTDDHSYKVIASPEMKDVITRDTLNDPYRRNCLSGTSATLHSDVESRRVLNLVRDMRVGTSVYLLADDVRVVGQSGRGFTPIDSVTRSTEFPGSARIQKLPDGTLRVDRPLRDFDEASSSEIQRMTGASDYQSVIIT